MIPRTYIYPAQGDFAVFRQHAAWLEVCDAFGVDPKSVSTGGGCRPILNVGVATAVFGFYALTRGADGRILLNEDADGPLLAKTSITRPLTDRKTRRAVKLLRATVKERK